MQLPLFAPDSSWRAPKIGALPTWEGARRVSIDVETRDPQLRELGPGVRRDPNTNYIVGFSFALSDGATHSQGYYVPLFHAGGDNVEDPFMAIQWLREEAARFDGELVGMHLNYDLDWLAELGIHFPRVKRFRDVMLAETLIYELHLTYSLDAILSRRGLPLKNEELLKIAASAYKIDPKADMWQLPARFVGEYGEGDATRPFDLLKMQEKDIADQNLQGIWDLESDLLPVLVKMRRRGIRIDFGKLDQVVDWSLKEEMSCLNEVHRLTGHRIKVGDVWKANALAPALIEAGVRLSKTPRTGAYKIDKLALDTAKHPVAQALARARKVNKLRTTFAASIERYAVRGRIHTTLVQLAGEDEQGGKVQGGRFGRMACKDPNLQQQPSKDDFAPMWRSIYIPEEGAQWCCADISQQEPRWAADFAAKLKLPGAEEMVRRYREDPKTDNHTMMAEITGLPRKYAKIIGLGLMYGKGGFSLCEELGLPTRTMVRNPRGGIFEVNTPAGQQALLMGGQRFRAAGEEGQQILDRYDANAPFVRKLSKTCQAVAKKRGYLITILGRRCRFPKDADGNYDWTYRALNRLIQGSSADQMKKAMIDVDRAGHFLQLQVHDELDLSIGSSEEGHRVGQIIQDAVPASLPFKVDVEIGPSWGEAE